MQRGAGAKGRGCKGARARDGDGRGSGDGQPRAAIYRAARRGLASHGRAPPRQRHMRRPASQVPAILAHPAAHGNTYNYAWRARRGCVPPRPPGSPRRRADARWNNGKSRCCCTKPKSRRCFGGAAAPLHHSRCKHPPTRKTTVNHGEKSAVKLRHHRKSQCRAANPPGHLIKRRSFSRNFYWATTAVVRGCIWETGANRRWLPARQCAFAPAIGVCRRRKACIASACDLKERQRRAACVREYGKCATKCG